MHSILSGGLFYVQPGKEQSEDKEDAAQVTGEGLQHICSLRAEKVFRHSPAEGGTEPFILWPLHEHHQDDEQRHHNVKHQKDIDRDG